MALDSCGANNTAEAVSNVAYDQNRATHHPLAAGML